MHCGATSKECLVPAGSVIFRIAMQLHLGKSLLGHNHFTGHIFEHHDQLGSVPRAPYWF